MTTITAPVRPRRAFTLLKWVLGISAVCFLLAAIAIANLVTLNADASALRRELVSALSSKPHLRVQVSVGPLLLSSVRAGLSFFHDIPPEAQLALRGVQKASVGVYELDGPVPAGETSRMFVSADKMMERRGWSRVVGVNDHDTLVLVYMPTEQDSKTSERVCVAVCADNHLVVVAGKLRFEPLVQLALQQRVLAQR